MAKAKVKSMKASKKPYEQEHYQKVVKKGDGKLTEEKAVKLRSDRIKGYSPSTSRKTTLKAKSTNTI